MFGKKYILCLLTCLVIGMGSYAQSPVYFSSGNFNPPNSWTQSAAVKMNTVANTNILVAPATAVGSCYYRFYSALSGGTIYQPTGNANLITPLDTPFALQIAGGNNSGYYFQTYNTTDNYVFKSNGTGAPGTAMAAIVRVQGAIQSAVHLTQSPAGNVYPGQDVSVSVTLSAAFSTGQGVYLRYSYTNWASSTIVEMTGSGTAYSAVIPGASNTASATLNYYVFTSGSGLTITHAYADLMTINLFNNGGSNYSYKVQCPFTSGNTYFNMVQTDKAQYNVADSVQFNVTFNTAVQSSNLIATYYHLADSIGSTNLSINNTTQATWKWQPPATDYQGYNVRLQLIHSNAVIDSTDIAVDVSSNWAKFPRYGFLSSYPETDSVSNQQLFERLNRYHLNGLQVYDAQYKHHEPLAGTVANPDTIWPDIANRATYLSTINKYITLAHQHNMKAMAYNLIYGADSTSALADSVKLQWGLYTDQNHLHPEADDLPKSWASNIIFENPADTGWQRYLLNKEQQLFKVIPFDGWHIDQVGSFGTVYNYTGQAVNVTTGFASMITKAKSTLNVDLVMNAVTDYGQQQIAPTPVDFLYTEVWPPYNTYNDLVSLINTNNNYSNHTLSNVLAAYVDRGISNSPGTFNTPAVLFTDAALFAAGGAHIELGEHMLGNEYYPNSNLVMPCALANTLIKYYDFSVAYENLLRDSIKISTTTLQCKGISNLSTAASAGGVWYMSRYKDNLQLFHLINLMNAKTINWNDPNNNQTAPITLNNIPFTFSTSGTVVKVYVASPDGATNNMLALPFIQSGGTVSFTVPGIDYWTMVVVEYTPGTNHTQNISAMQHVEVYPDPAIDNVTFVLHTAQQANAQLTLYDALGHSVYSKNISNIQSADTLTVPLQNMPKGLYLWSVNFIDAETGRSIIERGKLVHQ